MHTFGFRCCSLVQSKNEVPLDQILCGEIAGQRCVLAVKGRPVAGVPLVKRVVWHQCCVLTVDWLRAFGLPRQEYLCDFD